MKNEFDTIKKRKRLGVKLIAFGMVLVGLVILADIRIRPIITKTSTYQSQIYAARIINSAILEELENGVYDYNSLITLVYDDVGNVKSVESNMVNINRLKSRSAVVINEEIKNVEPHDLSISMGTVSGIHMLYGYGPTIPIKIAPKGYANTVLVSKFISAGINQTHHQIIMEIDVDISAIIPGYTTSVNVSTNLVIAETIILGEVPESYTNIVIG